MCDASDCWGVGAVEDEVGRGVVKLVEECGDQVGAVEVWEGDVVSATP